MVNIEIIEAGEKETKERSDFIRSAWKEAGPESLGWTGASKEIIHDLASEKYLHEVLNDPKMKIFLSEEYGKAVGFAVDRVINNDVVELAGIIVIQDRLGRGYGSALLENARKWAGEHGYKQMIVRTEENNERAISFYKSKGFVEVERTIEDIFGSKVAIVTLKHDLTK